MKSNNKSEEGGVSEPEPRPKRIPKSLCPQLTEWAQSSGDFSFLKRFYFEELGHQHLISLDPNEITHYNHDKWNQLELLIEYENDGRKLKGENGLRFILVGNDVKKLYRTHDAQLARPPAPPFRFFEEAC